MQIHPTPLAIALAIILSTSSVSVVAAPLQRYPASFSERADDSAVILEPRQGAHERNGMRHGLMHTPTAPSSTPVATVTSFKTIVVRPTPRAVETVEGGTMRPVTSASSSSSSDSSSTPSGSPSTSPPEASSTPTPPPSTKESQSSVIQILPSSSIVITIPTPSTTIIVPTPNLSALTKVSNIVIPLSSATPLPSSSSSLSAAEAEAAAEAAAAATESQQSEQSTSSSQQTCPATATRKCCTTLAQVSNSLLDIIDNILPVLHLNKFQLDTTTSSPMGLTCTDLADDGVCDNVVSCCTEKTILGLESVYMSCLSIV